MTNLMMVSYRDARGDTFHVVGWVYQMTDGSEVLVVPQVTATEEPGVWEAQEESAVRLRPWQLICVTELEAVQAVPDGETVH